MEKESHMLNTLNCNFLRPNWEHSMDQNDPFESALSSMVSSPTASNPNTSNGENIVLRELIGRLGSICNSGEVSPFNNSAPTSCYSTPLNSPPKLNLSSSLIRERGAMTTQLLSLPTLAPFSADPGFAERAARFSCFANNNSLYEFHPKQISPHNQSIKINNPGSQPLTSVQENWESAPLQEPGICNPDSMENSTVSEQILALANPRKRKSVPKGKAKESTTPPKDAHAVAAASGNSESSPKKCKSEDEKQSSKKSAEPPKDYIHVRARRGEATDAHSLAERVRREKISERMKVLQDLVPGCNKVTGKAVMLDEIINYVQSLQRQVEFLSMKLATVNPRMEFNMEAALMSKDVMFQSRMSLPHSIYPSEAPNNINAAGTERHQSIQLDGFGGATSQVSSLWEDDLHSIVQMGKFQGILPTAQMKVEL